MTAKRLDDITLDLVKRLDDLDAKPTITADQVSKTAQEWRTIYRPENNVAIYTKGRYVVGGRVYTFRRLQAPYRAYTHAVEGVGGGIYPPRYGWAVFFYNLTYRGGGGGGLRPPTPVYYRASDPPTGGACIYTPPHIQGRTPYTPTTPPTA